MALRYLVAGTAAVRDPRTPSRASSPPHPLPTSWTSPPIVSPRHPFELARFRSRSHPSLAARPSHHVAQAAGAFYAPAAYKLYEAESAVTAAETALDALNARMKTVRPDAHKPRNARCKSRQLSALRVPTPPRVCQPSFPSLTQPPSPSLSLSRDQCDIDLARAESAVSRGVHEMASARAEAVAASQEVAKARDAAKRAQSALDDAVAAEKRATLRATAVREDVERARAVVAQKTKEKETSAVEEVRARLAVDKARANAMKAAEAISLPAFGR